MQIMIYCECMSDIAVDLPSNLACHQTQLRVGYAVQNDMHTIPLPTYLYDIDHADHDLLSVRHRRVCRPI